MPIPGCENYNARLLSKLKNVNQKCNAKEEVIKNTKRLLTDDEITKGDGNKPKKIHK